MNTAVSLVNESKLYSVIGKFFTDGYNLILELIQNAQRAQAQHVDIRLPYCGEHDLGPDTDPMHMLRITDDGSGIKDIVALLGIALSDWGQEVEVQDPAGMGFLQLIALSRQVHIQSCFGSIHLDCPRFLSSDSYRQAVLNSIDSDNRLERGTIITAELAKPWHYYLRVEHDLYRGFDQLELGINGDIIQPVSIRELEESAIKNHNLYRVTEYMGNQLFLEIGSIRSRVAKHSSVVNWYGQIIPLYGGCGMANIIYTGFYYLVRDNTPLTPRFPDRTCINQDDKCRDFMLFLNQCYVQMLRDYFRHFPPAARFTPHINAQLLMAYFEHENETELEGLDYIPVVENPFCGNGELSPTICTKSAMLKQGISFCCGSMQIDDRYTIGCDRQILPCYSVDEGVAPYLRKAGIPELVDISILNQAEKMINLEPLQLKLSYHDDSEQEISIKEALLMDDCNDPSVYAEHENTVLRVFDDFFEEAYVEDSERDRYVLEAEVRTQIEQQLVRSFSLIKLSFFDFLPSYHDISQISFQRGNLAVAYKDGSSRDYHITN
ncbi:MAG: hypothetical protein M0Q19_00525 [Candidatus Cloacimonetes bacterium]|jgi:hypothetical protein|nr:hypothetical protein [Candidatus Cloacimonadota bacterium]MDD3057626.1 hypothetical protein [Sphaerochaeta sp.]